MMEQAGLTEQGQHWEWGTGEWGVRAVNSDHAFRNGNESLPFPEQRPGWVYLSFRVHTACVFRLRRIANRCMRILVE